MKKTTFKIRNFVIAFSLTLISLTAISQTTLVNYNFNSGATYTALVPTTASFITSSVTCTEAFSTVTGYATGSLAFSSNTTSGNAVNMTNSSGSMTKYWQFNLGGGMLSSYKYFKLYLQAKRGTYGASTIIIGFSTDGTSFQSLSTTMTVNTAYTEKVFDLSSIASLNNQSNIYIRVYASGASGTGSLSIDNFQVQGVLSGPAEIWKRTGNNVFLENSANNVGLGFMNPQHRLEVAGSISLYNMDEDGDYALYFGREHSTTNYGRWGIQYVHAGEIGTNSLSGINFWIPYGNGGVYGNNFLFLADNGNVLIGKNKQVNSVYKLDVEGSIRANEIVVNTTGADFVFEKNYTLMSLNELEKSIKENKHLPGVPSANEMQINGMSISQTNTLLLQKVEELTLYIIEQNKRINELEKKTQK